MVRSCRRLIEVDFPVQQVSKASRDEKDSRLAHVPRIHIYPAHRPLAACRSTLLALLLPDPVDLAAHHTTFTDPVPVEAVQQYLDALREILQRWLERVSDSVSPVSSSRVLSLRNNPQLLDDPIHLRGLLMDFIASFSTWGNSLDPLHLETSRGLVAAGAVITPGAQSDRPLVVDPFAGGGAIPLEALRLGCQAFSSDLNPVAVLIQKTVLQYLPKHGPMLAAALEEWLAWAKPLAAERLQRFYPSSDDETPVAYLWARVVLSEAPDPGTSPVEVPLLRSMWLSRNPRRRRALRWVRDSRGAVSTATIIVTYADGKSREVRRPLLEIFEPANVSDVEPGTAARNSATCPVTGYSTPAKSVERQLKDRSGGASDARLYCVVVDRTGQGRGFRLPNEDDERGARVASAALSELSTAQAYEIPLVPDEPLPVMSGVFNAPIYGHDQWGKLFTPRQALALVTYCDLVREYVAKLKARDSDLATAVAAALGLIIDRLADLNASLCVWQLNTANTAHVFGRWALPMVVDFGEVNPLAGAGGSPDSAVRRATACMNDFAGALQGVAEVQACSATNLPLPDDSVDAMVTDPPYYNAIPYADLLDFFYVWLRRSIKDEFPGLFTSTLTEKDQEITEMSGWDSARYAHKDKAFFEARMTTAMDEARRVLKPSGAAVCVFAHKSTAGWEAMLQALVDAGWMITASWPIDTEMTSRLRAKNSAVLASSIHIVMRPRENPDGSLSTDDVGDWRDVLAELPSRIHQWMPRLAEEGVVGADAIFACLGPALEIYSRYSVVEKASGEKVALGEYLEEVWAAVSREALSMIFEGADASGFEEDARLTAMWLWTLHTSINGAPPEGARAIRGYSLEFDAARKIAQGLGAHLESLNHLVEVRGDTATLLAAGARAKYLFGKDQSDTLGQRRRPKKAQMTLDLAQEISDLEEEADDWAGGVHASPGRSVLDQLHQSMILFGAGRGEAVRRFLVEDGVGHNPQFWHLAQSLSALYPAGTDEKRWVDGVLARKKGLGL
jgi:adenine-specific DNA methylase